MAYEFRTRYKSVFFCVVFCISLFALLSVYPSPVLFSFFCHLRLLITSHVSLNLSYLHILPIMYPQTFLTYNITYHVSLNLSYLPILPIVYPQIFLTIITYQAYVISDNCGRPNCLLLRRITIINIILCQYHFFPMICFIMSIMSFVHSRQTLYRSLSRKMLRV